MGGGDARPQRQLAARGLHWLLLALGLSLPPGSRSLGRGGSEAPGTLACHSHLGPGTRAHSRVLGEPDPGFGVEGTLWGGVGGRPLTQAPSPVRPWEVGDRREGAGPAGPPGGPGPGAAPSSPASISSSCPDWGPQAASSMEPGRRLSRQTLAQASGGKNHENVSSSMVEEDSEAQRGKVTCLRTQVAEPGLQAARASPVPPVPPACCQVLPSIKSSALRTFGSEAA
jgi:hypothetical protein